MKTERQHSDWATAVWLLLFLTLALPSYGQASGGGADRHAQALEFRRMRLQDENGQIPADAWMKAAAQKKQMPVDPRVWPTIQERGGFGGPNGPRIAGIRSSAWTWLGPGNIGGRVRSILIHPTTPTTMWVGSVGGGVWKTLDGGSSWFPLDDLMVNLAISCMVMDPTNPDVIYAGTGEHFGNGDAIGGAGIFKTTDGGATWARLPLTAGPSFAFVNRLAISPADHTTILAATWVGILQTRDGGISWTQVHTSEMQDLAFDPADGTKCIASGRGRVAFSTNGGLTWTNSLGIPTNAPFPRGRVEIAYAPSSPNIVYASVDNNGGELFESTDGGKSFGFVNTGLLGDQGWYDNCIWVDPTDPNTVIVGGIDLWLTKDGGSTFFLIGDFVKLHPDQHVIVNHPAYDGAGNRTLFFGNDGGVYRSPDMGVSYANLNHNLGITQFYGVAGDTAATYLIAGSQDNGVLHLRLGDGTEGWTPRWIGDGGFCAVDPTDPTFYYGEFIHLQIERSTELAGFISTGIADAGFLGADDPNANFIAPFILDPNNPNTMLAGARRLWRSTNVKSLFPGWSIIKPGIPGGSTISSNNISAIAVAKGNPDVIWVGHNQGEVFVTLNGTAASPTWFRVDMNAPGLPARFCTRITIDPLDPNLVYVTFGGFSSRNVWRTSNGGLSWANISGNLPEAPVNTLVVDPRITSWLYIGTEVGVFASDDGGAHWSPSNDGPANVAVDELAWVGIHLVAATHGRGCFWITPAVWVDFNLTPCISCGNGTFEDPFHNLVSALTFLSPGGTVHFKPGFSGNCPAPRDCFPATIRDAMTLEAVGGPVTIGQ